MIPFRMPRPVMRHRLVPICCLLLALPPSGAGAADAGIRVRDATGETIVVRDSSRVVSVGGAVSEVIHALGLAGRVIAVDSTSRYPEEVASKPDIGYMRQLAAEPILALTPSLVLAEEDSGPPAALDQLREAGVPVVLVPDAPSSRGVLDKIALVAAALDVPERGRALAARFETEIDAVSAAVARAPVRPRVLFLLTVGRGGTPLAAGRGTSASGIIRLAGGVNAIDAFEGFKPLSSEAVVVAAPDVILVTDRSLELLGGVEGLLRIPEIALTPAGRRRRIIAMDGLLLLGFGPRTAAAVMELVRRLHPGVPLHREPDES